MATNGFFFFVVCVVYGVSPSSCFFDEIFSSRALEFSSIRRRLASALASISFSLSALSDILTVARKINLFTFFFNVIRAIRFGFFAVQNYLSILCKIIFYLCAVILFAGSAHENI